MCASNEQAVRDPAPPEHPDDKLWFNVISHWVGQVDQGRSTMMVQEAHVHPVVFTLCKPAQKRLWRLGRDTQPALCGKQPPTVTAEQIVRPVDSVDTMTVASVFESLTVALERAEIDNAYFKASEGAERRRIAASYNRDDDKYGPVMLMGTLRRIDNAPKRAPVEPCAE